MGVIEIVVALCLQAEPANCRISREKHAGGVTACLVADIVDSVTATPGWYRARYSCRWRG
ncbi:hypothetical protein [Hansschlegelia zhihuaiae]|uniref:Uncharacterized protein n=1 Tax=Hansschlegelia zhihuaiae TaxID=405005 RepID=A0A4Q0MN95_9HYPH|nr:hypothetical protein [Hansschlegelia zhihuaiae]RXF75331.1 hypothetical protein EK403_00230 [Hansschlegelia zhihuaiae]